MHFPRPFVGVFQYSLYVQLRRRGISCYVCFLTSPLTGVSPHNECVQSSGLFKVFYWRQVTKVWILPNSSLRHRVAYSEYCATWDNLMGIEHDISISSRGLILTSFSNILLLFLLFVMIVLHSFINPPPFSNQRFGLSSEATTHYSLKCHKKAAR